ncbi:MAG: hypothetical protein WBC27_04880 [Candidatus Nanopelagicales bacterium]
MKDAGSTRLSVVRALRSTLFITLRTDVVQPTARSATQAVHDYTGIVKVEWSPERGQDVDLTALSAMTNLDVEGFVPEVDSLLPKTLVIPVGRGEFVTADLQAPDCWEELDSRGHDLGLVGRALLGEGFDLAELRAAFELVHMRAVIVNSMEIDPEWRGAKLGLLATELAIRELGKGADVAALFPMKPGLADLAERAAANRALSGFWGHLGFVEFNGIMVRDLTR